MPQLPYWAYNEMYGNAIMFKRLRSQFTKLYVIN